MLHCRAIYLSSFWFSLCPQLDCKTHETGTVLTRSWSMFPRIRCRINRKWETTLFVLQGPHSHFHKGGNSIIEHHVFVVVHVVDATVDDMRKALAQSPLPWNLSSELIVTLPQPVRSPYEVISICSMEGCALQMKVKHPCSTESKLFQLSKLTTYPGFSQANSCYLGTVVWILSDNI